MARCKNVRGSPPGGDRGDGGNSPPRLIEVAQGKRKLISMKKRTRKDRETEEALAVAQATERAESGGRGSGILISESRTRVPLSGRVLGIEATEATEDHPKELAEQEHQTPPSVLDAPRVLRRH
jgi:GTPase involved in cell partitioning and DNA repair